jgi:protein-disulfide isomerase
MDARGPFAYEIPIAVHRPAAWTYIRRMPHVRLSALAALTVIIACESPQPRQSATPLQRLFAERALKAAATDAFSPAIDRGRVLGDSSAAVWVVIVSDFQCADCKRWNDDVLPMIKRDYVSTKRVRVAYLNMPLPVHLNGMTSAIAAACASAQGKFWETAAGIFATQSRWKDLPDARPYLDSVAIAAGASAEAERSCTEQARAMKLVLADVERNKAAGVDSLPTFFVGTHKLAGLVGAATFRAIIDSALAGR